MSPAHTMLQPITTACGRSGWWSMAGLTALTRRTRIGADDLVVVIATTAGDAAELAERIAAPARRVIALSDTAMIMPVAATVVIALLPSGSGGDAATIAALAACCAPGGRLVVGATLPAGGRWSTTLPKAVLDSGLVFLGSEWPADAGCDLLLVAAVRPLEDADG